jgi:hypothetical protein
MKTKLLIISLPFFFSCSVSKEQTLTPELLGTPPGTEKLSDNLYLDKAEIRNVDYLEFLHWTKAAYGSHSSEYTSILPDTNFWSKMNPELIRLDSNYLRHPAYRSFSVMGVSNEQAKKFTSWRADRVMEFILIKNGILEHTTITRDTELFTIKKYFSGEFSKAKPDKFIPFYPDYRLIDSTDNTRVGFKNICTYKKWQK